MIREATLLPVISDLRTTRPRPCGMESSGHDVLEVTLRDRVLDLHGHPGAGAQSRIDEVGVRGSGDERVGSGDDPG